MIRRDPEAASDAQLDLIVLGGGIYGAMLVFEAAKRGLRPLLLERDDFGGATSFNSLRIIHGGLRYLQSMDLPRFHESVQERRWFLQTFPDLVRPLPCLMPLYDRGLQRASVFKLALRVNDALSRRRNRGVRQDRHLPAGSILNSAATQRLFPMVDRLGLRGSALWYDACMPDSQRIVMETLRRGCALGAQTLNYVEAETLVQSGDAVQGIVARDRETGKAHEFSARVVVNATGPWSRITAQRFDRDEESLFRSSIAWNLLFDREALSDHALAVVPKREGGQTYFLHPWKGRLLAGTGHAPWNGGASSPSPSDEQLGRFVRDLNDAIPGLHLSTDEITRVFAGLLPAKDQTGSRLAVREVIIDHGRSGGPKGLFSVSGVKFTSSRRVADKCLRQIFGRRIHARRRDAGDLLPPPRMNWDFGAKALLTVKDKASWAADLRNLAAEEAVVHLDDLYLRRTTLWEDKSSALALAPDVCRTLGWGQARTKAELQRLMNSLGEYRLCVHE